MSGYLIIAVALLLTATLVVCGVIGGSQGFHPERLWTFTNYGGPAGGSTFPETESLVWLFALGLLLPAYTITGFDSSAQTAEETVDPSRNVPRAIVRGVIISGIGGWVMLSAMVLAIPDMDEAAKQGGKTVFFIIRTVVPQPLRTTLYVGLIAAMYLCGLATLMSVSRLIYAFARDGGLPFSGTLQRIGTHRTPSAAIWTAAALASLFAALPYEAIAAVCAAFLYLSYVLPITLGLFAHDRSWTKMGPWHLGRCFRPLAALCAIGCVALIFIGMQPPNQIAVPIVGCVILGLIALWFGYMRHHFPGPKPNILGPSEEHS